MKKYLFLTFCLAVTAFSRHWIRVNQAGYLPEMKKNAVVVSKDTSFTVRSFDIRNALTDERILTSHAVKRYGGYGPFASTFRLDFSNLKNSGAYYIIIDSVRSPVFRVSASVYNGSSDFLLQYMRQQRSGYNPYLSDSCHTNDGFIIYHPSRDSLHINVSGGWHDASDYLQYVTTSATAVFQMLFAYQRHPSAFKDRFTSNGLSGSNGIPDILDEAKWGLDWLLKMNPEPEMFFNQIADDRDHRGFRLPTEDTVNYGRGTERPVYFINGKPQGIFNYKNRTTGAASTVAKYASAYALGSELLKRYYPEYSDRIRTASIRAYEFAKRHPGVSQTAPCRAPYFYEEDNWMDDMELAASQLYAVTGSDTLLHDAVFYGSQEPVTPWLGADAARHYQWYPFVNIGHYRIAEKSSLNAALFIQYLRTGIEMVHQRGKENAFLFGIPFIWCSNNLVSSFLSQLYLYRTLSKDSSYLEMESSLRDWLFGCNPWGTSMIVGFPAFGDTPVDPHSAFTHVYHYPVNGGLIDGPVRETIFEQHKKYIRLTKADPYEEFQSSLAVYHDDWGDYTNNEPTMDGTAGLTIYLSSLESSSPVRTDAENMENSVISEGAVVRMDTTKKTIYLIFTGHEFADGGTEILRTLKRQNIKASFFLTGDFYRNKKHEQLIQNIRRERHYLGAHSDKHLLYASWENRDSLLITQQQFAADIKNNYRAMQLHGIAPSEAEWFLPPFEWYNASVSSWTEEYGLTLINFTPGTSSNADYTTPDMLNYISSDSIAARIFRYESVNTGGLNGFLLLTHIGTSDSRNDKFYRKLNGVIGELKRRGYSFKRL